jgi:hypothetical protein
MSKDPGFKILDLRRPPPEMINAAMAEISVEDLDKFRNSYSSLGFEKLGWGTNCESLFLDGFDVSSLSSFL